MQPTWEFWIDVGGTFTDCLARRDDGSLVTCKLLSSGVTKGRSGASKGGDWIEDPSRCSDPAGFWTGYELRLLDEAGRVLETRRVSGFEREIGRLTLDQPFERDVSVGTPYELASGEEAPIVAIRYLLGLGLGEDIPPVSVRLGTTRGTNALITRRGARTALVTTAGFGDVLLIGNQARPRLFDLAIRKPEPLFERTVEVDERIDWQGEVLEAPDGEKVREQLAQLKRSGIESLAICFLHAFAHPEHETLVERIAKEVGFDEISVSSRVAPMIKIVSRGETTVMDAYLNPILRDYVTTLRRALGSSSLKIMTSAGGLVSAERFVGKDSILSGPAGGVVGFSRVAQRAGFAKSIGFDMGGTSTDVSRFDGRFELEYEAEKAGVRVVAPMMAIETVAAGGGSICDFDGVKLTVGPDSAGAEPGPVCYGRGGPLAVTDLNLYLGKILPEHFPFPLDRDAVHRRLSELADEIAAAPTGHRYTPVALAEGFLKVANANMVKPIRAISVAKGYDPREYVLVSFGGAGAQHACAIARELGIGTILIHPYAGILSAYGIGLADVKRHRDVGVYEPYSEQAVADLEARLRELQEEARQEVLDEGIPPDRIEPASCALDLRYRGVEAAITVPEPSQGSYAEQYAKLHRQLYGYVHEGRPLEIVALRVEVVGKTPDPPRPIQAVTPRRPVPEKTTTAYFGAEPFETGVYLREALHPGDEIAGPAILCEATSTIVIDPGFEARLLEGGEVVITDRGGTRGREAVSTRVDPIMLEVFNNLFASIAEQMGLTLERTSSSTNVKERLDFSCALFTPTGDLVVNAPHIPVHLGAMGETVKRVLLDNPEIHPGDVFVTNDPYRGGSHLPDVTVVSPVHDETSGAVLFFTASRAHHAEIGGIVPGSMPPFSKNLSEEGVLIRKFKLVDAGTSHENELRELLLSAAYPTRNVEDNLADISAQVAANNAGARLLGEMITRYSLRVVKAYMGHIQEAAAEKMRRALERLPDGAHRFCDHLDDGSPIAVTITVDGTAAHVDFTGTGPVVAGNLNANRAIVTAAVLYCFRCLIDEDIPLNSGVLEPLTITLPECLLNPPEHEDPARCAAVVGGNVETSQRVVDVLFGALKVAAASQGTMNNFIFGDVTGGYYETICGGSGATANAPGADAVHTHMTNTRLTDPEVIERRYPVRIRRFAIRQGSGGAGRHRGGNGVVREIEFLKAQDVSILSERRGQYAPYGVEEGGPGACGRNTLRRAEGDVENLGGKVQFRAEAGDLLVIETPGGGGWGKPDDSAS